MGILIDLINNMKSNLSASDEQYRVCNGSNYDCCQTLIYPKEMKIPFEKLL